MNRRALLRDGGMALLAFGLSGCAPRRTTPGLTTSVRPPVHLAHVNVGWDRIIRATVGLRPHRPSGFVLRAEKLDDKMLVHNFGHWGDQFLEDSD